MMQAALTRGYIVQQVYHLPGQSGQLSRTYSGIHCAQPLPVLLFY